MNFTLSNVEELSGLHAVWVSESIKVYATPDFEDIPVPVHVIDCNGQEIGMDTYTAEIESFERYCEVVQILTAKILRRSQM